MMKVAHHVRRWPLASVLVLALLSCTKSGTAPIASPPQATVAVAKQPQAGAEVARAIPAGGDVPGVAVGYEGAVAAAEPLATAVGLQVLKEGGNAIDAAIAVGFALAVTHPTAGNLGGGGFMVVRMADGTATALDYRETAPMAATPEMYLDAAGELTGDSVIGPKAAGIPGTVAGFALAHRRFGSMPLSHLLAPAIALAEEGHALDENHAERLQYAVNRMRQEGLVGSVPYYTHEDGSPYAVGEVWRQPELAATLKTLASDGLDAFYRGPFAERFATEVQKLGGVWTAQDLARYEPREREPLRFEFKGYHVLSMPPPSAGGIVLRQLLAGAAMRPMATPPFASAAAAHLFVEMARRAYADRNMLLGDPDFVDVPTTQLTDLSYIQARMQTIDPDHATPSSEIRPGLLPSDHKESHETTHYSVVDRFGNAVANTYTLNTGFGSKVIVPGTGILLNNEMNDFAVKPGDANVYGLIQGQNNRVEPGKRMLSSMTPTIVEREGKLRAVVGTPGGPTITNPVALILLSILDHGLRLDEAVRAPRLHHQWYPDEVFVGPGTAKEVVEGLVQRGHKVQVSPFGPIGHANCIEVDPATGGLRAVADVTREKGGAALAY